MSTDDSSIIIQLIKHNQDFKDLITEQNKIIWKIAKEMTIDKNNF